METNLTPSANKISKEEFFKILDAQKAQNERVDKITDAGISIWDSDLVEYGNLMFERVIDAYFTKDGVDWIFWWLYEKAGNPEIRYRDYAETSVSSDVSAGRHLLRLPTHRRKWV